MKELGQLIHTGAKGASTGLEKQCVESWREGIWEYMQKGHAEYLKKKNTQGKHEED